MLRFLGPTLCSPLLTMPFANATGPSGDATGAMVWFGVLGPETLISYATAMTPEIAAVVHVRRAHISCMPSTELQIGALGADRAEGGAGRGVVARD